MFGNLFKRKTDTTPSENPAFLEKYKALRNKVFATTPEQFQTSAPEGQSKVYGTIMEWDVGKSVATMAAFDNGVAHIYTSNGLCIETHGQDEAVKKAAKDFFDQAKQLQDETDVLEIPPYPAKDYASFYLLTDKGMLAAQEKYSKFEMNRSAWLPMLKLKDDLMKQLIAFAEGG